jgi:multidrug efflux pump subunit AcrA (membrane-fusion protein)
MMYAQQVRFISKLALLTATSMLILGIASLAQAQQRFNTPDAAVEALVAAARRGDSKAVVLILGPGSQELVSSGDPVEDANVRQEYLAAYDAQYRIVSESGKPSVLVIGQNEERQRIRKFCTSSQEVFRHPLHQRFVIRPWWIAILGGRPRF